MFADADADDDDGDDDDDDDDDDDAVLKDETGVVDERTLWGLKPAGT